MGRRRSTVVKNGDPDLKMAALTPPSKPTAAKAARASPTRAWSPATTSGRKSPAERLALAGESLEKAVKCLAEAVYFESRASRCAARSPSRKSS